MRIFGYWETFAGLMLLCFFGFVVLAMLLCGGCHIGPTRLLMRSVEMDQIEGFAARPDSLRADIFVYGHQGEFEEQVQALKDSGKGCFRYFNTTHVPPEAGREWRGSPWLDFQADSVLAGWNGYLVNAQGDTAYYFAYGGKDYIINWAEIDSSRAERMARKMRDLSPGCSCFLDVWFQEPLYWMFHTDGARYEDFPQWTFTWARENRERFLRIARRTYWKNGQPNWMKVPVMVNGDWYAGMNQTGARPAAVMLEAADRSNLGSYQQGLAVWRARFGNALTVWPERRWVDSTLAHWEAEGGVIGFKGVGQLNQNAYERAWASRED